MSNLPWLKIDCNLIRSLLRPRERDDAIAIMVMTLDYVSKGLKPEKYYAEQFGRSRNWVRERLRTLKGHKKDIKRTQKGHLNYINYNEIPEEKDNEKTLKGHKKDIKRTRTIKNKNIEVDKPIKKRTLIDDYHDLFIKRYKVKPHINGVKDGAILKRIAQAHGEDKARELLERFFEDDDVFVVKSAHSIGVFSTQVNRYLVKGKETSPMQRGLQRFLNED